jgi:hypothetical protein
MAHVASRRAIPFRGGQGVSWKARSSLKRFLIIFIDATSTASIVETFKPAWHLVNGLGPLPMLWHPLRGSNDPPENLFTLGCHLSGCLSL